MKHLRCPSCGSINFYETESGIYECDNLGDEAGKLLCGESFTYDEATDSYAPVEPGNSQLQNEFNR